MIQMPGPMRIYLLSKMLPNLQIFVHHHLYRIVMVSLNGPMYSILPKISSQFSLKVRYPHFKTSCILLLGIGHAKSSMIPTQTCHLRKRIHPYIGVVPPQEDTPAKAVGVASIARVLFVR